MVLNLTGKVDAMEINFPLMRRPLVLNESNLTFNLSRQLAKSSSMVMGGGDPAAVHAA